MEDKTFELLEKMYGEMQSGFNRLDKKIEQEVARLDRKIEQETAKIENKIDENHKALYDRYKQSIEGINGLKRDIKELKGKVENQEIELRVIKGGK
ncbi:hypothetical protein [Wukongibacter sp. M2B1]|uniref:hypothetical protein n=1 Tax=Wukongibacter sp. M2B1 TaxID=3088895 RepID=UPI003D7BAFA4